MRDTIVVTVSTHYDWRDRLRILFGRMAMTQVRVAYDGEAWCEKNSTSVWVQALFERHGPAGLTAPEESCNTAGRQAS